jgi:methionine sulfoxide reductase heme-binding subunit
LIPHAAAFELLAAGPSPLWFLNRSAGEVTVVLMSVAMILGIVRAALPTAYPVSVEGAHANIALLTLAFAGVHVLASVLDPFARLGPIDVFVPFVSAYRGTWLGLGVISGYLYGVSVIMSWPARRLPRAVWIWVHRTMYVAWVLAIVHSLGTGSDVQNQVFLLLNVAAVAGVLAVFLAVRVAEGWRQIPLVWSAAGLVAILVVLALAAWAVNGPLQSGWARSSGTPPDLLRSP